jgi:hypothetical protein
MLCISLYFSSYFIKESFFLLEWFIENEYRAIRSLFAAVLALVAQEMDLIGLLMAKSAILNH